MDACSLRQDQQLGRARWWRSRLRSETGRSEQGRYILRHSAVGGLTGARSVWRKISRQVRSYAQDCTVTPGRLNICWRRQLFDLLKQDSLLSRKSMYVDNFPRPVSMTSDSIASRPA